MSNKHYYVTGLLMEPNNRDVDIYPANCVAFMMNFVDNVTKWTDAKCTNMYPFVCERPQPCIASKDEPITTVNNQQTNSSEITTRVVTQQEFVSSTASDTAPLNILSTTSRPESGRSADATQSIFIADASPTVSIPSQTSRSLDFTEKETLSEKTANASPLTESDSSTFSLTSDEGQHTPRTTEHPEPREASGQTNDDAYLPTIIENSTAGVMLTSFETESISAKYQVESSTEVGVSWGAWIAWSSCSYTCGRGVRMRFKLCEIATDENCTKIPFIRNRRSIDRLGYVVSHDICTSDPCPVDGRWGLWSSWSTCSATCGQGTQRQSRHCIGRVGQGKECVGKDYEMTICELDECKRLHGI